MTTPQIFAVIGAPITHSLSPIIHQQFAKLMGISIHYTAECVTEIELADFLHRFAAKGGVGLNVTSPLKQVVTQYASQMSQTVKKIGAANTVSFLAPGVLKMDNTDGTGLMQDLTRLQWQIQRARVLIIGAGGVVAGILPSLLPLQPKQVVIINRNFDRAQQLVEKYSVPVLCAEPWQSVHAVSYDIVLHAMSEVTPDISTIFASAINSNTRCYDINYGNKAKRFLELARQYHPAQISDGLGMLLHQAAESFYLWHGVYPPVDEVLKKSQEFGENYR